MADITPERDPEQENLFKEIDEELRQEKMAVLWKKYGTLIIGAAVLVVGSVAAFQAWQAWDSNRRSAESAKFATALDAATRQRPADALQTFAKLAKDGRATDSQDNAIPGTKVLVRMATQRMHDTISQSNNG